MFAPFSPILVSLALAVAGIPTDQYSGRQEVAGGFATSYSQQGLPGACCHFHSDSDMIVSLPTQVYASGENCGRKVQVTDVSNGIVGFFRIPIYLPTQLCICPQTADAIVADKCFTCINAESLDLSLGFFQVFAPLSTGEFPSACSFYIFLLKGHLTSSS